MSTRYRLLAGQHIEAAPNGKDMLFHAGEVFDSNSNDLALRWPEKFVRADGFPLTSVNQLAYHRDENMRGASHDQHPRHMSEQWDARATMAPPPSGSTTYEASLAGADPTGSPSTTMTLEDQEYIRQAREQGLRGASEGVDRRTAGVADISHLTTEQLQEELASRHRQDIAAKNASLPREQGELAHRQGRASVPTQGPTQGPPPRGGVTPPNVSAPLPGAPKQDRLPIPSGAPASNPSSQPTQVASPHSSSSPSSPHSPTKGEDKEYFAALDKMNANELRAHAAEEEIDLKDTVGSREEMLRVIKASVRETSR